MEKNYSFICDYAFIGENRKIGAIGIFERVKKNFTISNWFLITSFSYTGTISNLKVNVRLMKNGNNVENIFEKALLVNDKQFKDSKTTVIVQCPPKTFTEIGDYILQTYIFEESSEVETIVGETKFVVVEAL